MSDQQCIDEIIDGINAGLSLMKIEMQFQTVDVNLTGRHGRTPLMSAVVKRFHSDSRVVSEKRRTVASEWF